MNPGPDSSTTMTVTQRPQKVAIIGAGPIGLFLAIALHQQGIACTIYEKRGPSFESGYGILLSPNGLRIIQTLGLADEVLKDAYWIEKTDIVDNDGNILDCHWYAHEKVYGMKCARVARMTVLHVAEAKLKQCDGVELRYNVHFNGVVSDSESGGVLFDVDGKIEYADMLVGADGVFSMVRSHITSATPKYGGWLGILNKIPRSEIQIPDRGFSPFFTLRGSAGAFLVIPEHPGDDMFTTVTQMWYPEQSREEYRAMREDHGKIKAILRKDYEQWGKAGRSVIDLMCAAEETFHLWPGYIAPTLDEWMSPTRRVVLVGDAAHALSPSTGQGVSQGIEDIASLAFLLNRIDSQVSLAKAMDHWQSVRQRRINQVRDMGRMMDIKRMPEAQRAEHEVQLVEDDLDQLADGGGEGTYGWLFNYKPSEEHEAWLQSQRV